jgi:phosphoribosylformimino-5-aminoimidazole carboxamide ribotide isomerase
MLLIPAIDIKQGRCVRLYKGNYNSETSYGDNPCNIAVEFEKRGAKRLHIIDLDAAITEKSFNFPLVAEICKTVHIPIEFGGGVHTVKSAEKYLETGVSEVILGTIVVREPRIASEIIKICGNKYIQIGFDFLDKAIAVKGWQELIPLNVSNEILKWKDVGVERFILTDISKDGTLQGQNISVFYSIARKTQVKITVSGGISNPKDIEKLIQLESLGVDRVIVGKAIYEGTVTIEEFC